MLSDLKDAPSTVKSTDFQSVTVQKGVRKNFKKAQPFWYIT